MDKSTRASIKCYECVHFCFNSRHEKFISTSNYQNVERIKHKIFMTHIPFISS